MLFEDDIYWNDFSIDLKKLLVKMLNRNYELRISIEEALNSSWIISNTNENPRVKAYCLTNFLKSIIAENSKFMDAEDETYFELKKYIVAKIINHEKYPKILKSF